MLSSKCLSFNIVNKKGALAKNVNPDPALQKCGSSYHDPRSLQCSLRRGRAGNGVRRGHINTVVSDTCYVMKMLLGRTVHLTLKGVTAI